MHEIDKATLLLIPPVDAKVNPRPWTAADFDNFSQRHDVAGFVAIDEREEVLGYILGTIGTNIAAVLNIGVVDHYRRRHLGTAMLHFAKEAWLTGGRRYLNITVPDDNLGAHLFLKEAGFEASVIRGLYGEGNDGYRFVWKKPTREQQLSKYLRRAG